MTLNGEGTWLDLARWLKVDGGIPEVPPAAGNRAGRARFEGINHWLTQNGIKATASRWLPKGVKAAVGRQWYTAKGLPRLKDEDRRALYALFAEDIRETEALLGMDLSHWRPKGRRLNYKRGARLILYLPAYEGRNWRSHVTLLHRIFAARFSRGSLAQLVQSAALTGQRSLVRVQYDPL